MKKAKNKSTNLFWRITISLVGTALILIAVSQLLLFFFGASAAADVTIRRQGGANDGAPPSQRYEWSLDYTFTDQDGKVRSGHTTRRGSDTSVSTDDRVYYFTFAPFISALESDAEPGLSQLLYTVIGAFLIFVMNRKRKVPGKKSPAAKQVVHPDDLTDYDDSVEEQFHNQ